MVSAAERFWITFILRLAFGFLFLLAAINIFNAGGPQDIGPIWFADNLSKPFANSWLEILPSIEVNGEMKHLSWFFLVALPFVFAALSVPILTGIFLRPALRMGAVLLVLLGLGKYITSGNDLSTTAQDFLFALIICIGLYFLGQEDRRRAEELAM